ncbi:hypothetical protein [Pseudomonas sp. NPDC089406]|uniref:hypothetical protein n=1 Tax=Pseudomonas sp. NPDC089406 TaxID=3364463 RepID=UPI00384BAFB4
MIAIGYYGGADYTQSNSLVMAKRFVFCAPGHHPNVSRRTVYNRKFVAEFFMKSACQP